MTDSVQRSRLAIRIAIKTLSVGLLAFAVYKLIQADWRGALEAIANMEFMSVLIAIGFVVASFVAYAGYDLLAWRWMGEEIRFRSILFVSFVSTCVTMNVGIAALSGSAMRFKLYPKYGLSIEKIGEFYLRLFLLFGLGWALVCGLSLFWVGDYVSQRFALPKWLAKSGAWIALFVLLVYLSSCAKEMNFRFGKLQFHMLPIKLALGHCFVALADVTTSIGVLYAMVRSSGSELAETTAAYIGANTAGIASQIPGGIGVFEWVALELCDSSNQASMLGSLLVFRMIFFWIPLVVALVMYAKVSRNRIGNVATQ